MGLVTDKLLIGKETSNFAVDVSGGIKVNSLAGSGKMVVVDSSGVMGIQDLSGGDASGTGYVGFFGDGADGDASITGNTYLSKEMSYNNLHVTSTGNIYTQGYIIRVRGTLTINSGGVINSDGNSGSTYLAGSPAYYNPVYPEFGTPTYGGYGGEPGNSGSLTGYGESYGYWAILQGSSPIQFRAGSGGGGGGQVDDGWDTYPPGPGENVWVASGYGGYGKDATYSFGSHALYGGGGGGGGGVLCIYAYTINNGGVIRANGGNGGDGETASGAQAGGGGGGGGGTVVVHYRNTSGSGVGTLQANGGTAGSGGSGSGNNGQSGTTLSCRI